MATGDPIEIDHVAVPSNDVGASVRFYVERFGAEVLYQDATWALLRCGSTKLAIVSPRQHPPHVAFRVDEQRLAEAARAAGVGVERHRDGTTGIYVNDPFGNAVELICYPEGRTVYKADGAV